MDPIVKKFMKDTETTLGMPLSQAQKSKCKVQVKTSTFVSEQVTEIARQMQVPENALINTWIIAGILNHWADHGEADPAPSVH